MKSLLLLALCLSAPSAFASELTCRVIRNETIYTGQYNVLVTYRGIAIRKGSKMIASGYASGTGSYNYEIKRNNEMIEDGAEVYMSEDWKNETGGRFTIVDRTRDIGNVSTEFECEAK